MLASYRVVSLTPLTLVRFRLACCSGFHLVPRFFLIFGSGLVRLCRVPSVSPCAFSSRAFPASSLLSLPTPSHPSGSVVSSSPACQSALASAIAWARVIPSVRWLASHRRCRLSASCPCVSSSGCLARLRAPFRRASPPSATLRCPACFAHLGPRAALVLSCPVSPFSPPCLSSVGAMIEAAAVGGLDPLLAPWCCRR